MASTKSSTIKVKVPTNASWFSAACASAAKRSSIMRWRRAWASNATSPKNQQSCKGMETLKYMLGPNLPLFLMFFYGEGWEKSWKINMLFMLYFFWGGVHSWSKSAIARLLTSYFWASLWNFSFKNTNTSCNGNKHRRLNSSMTMIINNFPAAGMRQCFLACKCHAIQPWLIHSSNKFQGPLLSFDTTVFFG